MLSGFHVGDRLGVSIGRTPLVRLGCCMVGHFAGQLVAVRRLGFDELGGGDRFVRSHGGGSGGWFSPMATRTPCWPL